MSTWSGMGLNYGSTLNFNTAYPTAQVAADLPLIRAAVPRIRIAFADWNDNTGMTNTQTCALAAKALGFYVIFGVASGNTTLTSTNWSGYAAAVVALASWVQTNAIDEFSVGNELEIHIDGTTLTEATMRSNVRSLATSVKSAGYTGTVSYATGQGFSTHSAAWAADNNLGGLDVLALNTYGDNAYDSNLGFEYYVQTLYNVYGPTKMYMSEFNAFYTWTNAGIVAQPAEMIGRRVAHQVAALRAIGITTAYLFCYRFANDYFSARLANGDYHPLWFSALGLRPNVVGLPNTTVVSHRATLARNTPLVRASALSRPAF